MKCCLEAISNSKLCLDVLPLPSRLGREMLWNFRSEMGFELTHCRQTLARRQARPNHRNQPVTKVVLNVSL